MCQPGLPFGLPTFAYTVTGIEGFEDDEVLRVAIWIQDVNIPGFFQSKAA